MDGMEKRELICQTGRTLLEERLVARTWGNVSCRADDDSFYITPSGLDYTKTPRRISSAIIQRPRNSLARASPRVKRVFTPRRMSFSLRSISSFTRIRPMPPRWGLQGLTLSA